MARMLPMVVSLIVCMLSGGIFGYAAGAGITWLIITLALLIVLSVVGLVLWFCWWVPRKRRQAAKLGVESTKASAGGEKLPLFTLTLPRLSPITES